LNPSARQSPTWKHRVPVLLHRRHLLERSAFRQPGGALLLPDLGVRARVGRGRRGRRGERQRAGAGQDPAAHTGAVRGDLHAVLLLVTHGRETRDRFRKREHIHGRSSMSSRVET